MGLILKKSHLFGLITKDIIHVGDFRADIIVEGKVIKEMECKPLVTYTRARK